MHICQQSKSMIMSQMKYILPDEPLLHRVAEAGGIRFDQKHYLEECQLDF